MTSYSFFLLNAEGGVESSRTADFDGDAQAILHAHRIQEEVPRAAIVELWTASGMVARIARNPLAGDRL